MVSVKVANHTIRIRDNLEFLPLAAHPKAPKDLTTADFTKLYGNSYISGFQRGGNFLAVIGIKAKAKGGKRKLKPALTRHASLSSIYSKGRRIGGSSSGPRSSSKAHTDYAKECLSSSAETNIAICWSGSGSLEQETKVWDIDTVMDITTRFHGLVAQTPQPTHEILSDTYRCEAIGTG